MKPHRLLFKSEEAEEIYDLIGNHLLLNEFDKNISEYKRGQYGNALDKARHAASKMIIEVKKKRKEHQMFVRDWENEHFLETEHAPDHNAYPEDVKKAYELILLADKVIRSAFNMGK